jgi:hypothetical protein
VDIRGGCVYKTGSVVHATGNVCFTNCSRRLSASSILYDLATARGSMTDVYFTTCNKPKPDYHIEAKEIRMLSNNRIHAKGASIFIGTFKVITLPSMKFNMGQTHVARDQFPRPGYDANDGYTISQKFHLSDADRSRTNADLRVTTKNGLEGVVDSIWGLDGSLITLAGRFMTYDSLRSSALDVPRYFPETGCTPQPINAKDESQFNMFGRFALQQRNFDIRNSGLLVYREPEIGFAYTGRQINLAHSELDPRLQLYPTATASWGRFKEDPGTVGLTARDRLDCAIPVNVFPLGPRTAVQPVYMFSASRYATNTNYRMAAYAFDASHLFSNGSIVSMRYIKRNESGISPFIFDTVDVFHEFQGAFQARLKNMIVGYVTGYNGDTGTFYDWELLVGYHTDCIMMWASYDRRWKRFTMDAALINF